MTQRVYCAASVGKIRQLITMSSEQSYNVLECALRIGGVLMSSPAESEKDKLVQALAKQAYRHDLLIKALRAHGYLGAREPESLESPEEFEGFLKVFRLYFKEKPLPRESGES